MPGPAPKDASQRARRNAPANGEWVDLAPLTQHVLPLLPDEEWHPRTLAWWAGLRADPVTALFGDNEVAQCVELAYLHRLAIDSEKVSCWSELRQREDRLGLSPKGKRDLRFRVTNRITTQAAPGTLVAMPSSR